MDTRIDCFRRRRFQVGVVVLCLLAAFPLIGHAILKESSPAPNSVVSGPDITIRLRFNSRIDAAHSNLSLIVGSHSQQIQIARPAAPDTLLGQAKDLKTGEYRIQWQVLAVDGHITRGEVPFTVR